MHIFPSAEWFGKTVQSCVDAAAVRAVLGVTLTTAQPPGAYLTTAMRSDAATSFSNDNGVTFGLNGSTITASVKTDYQSTGPYLTTAQPPGNYLTTAQPPGNYLTTAQPPGNYLTTAMQSNAATLSNINVSAGTASNNLSALTFSNSNGVTFGLNGSVLTASVKTDYQSTGPYLTTAQPPGAYLTTAMQSNAATSFANGNGVTFGLVGSTLTASVAPAGGGGITNINVSAGTTSNNLSALTFSNSNGVTFGLNGSVLTATVATNYQSQGAYLTTAQSPGAYLTTADLSQNSSKYAGINGAMTGGSITVNTAGVSINLPAYLTTAQSPGAYLTTAMQSNAATVFSNGNGVTFGLNGSTITATVKTDYQTAGAYLTTADLSQNSSKYAGTNGAMTGGSITVNTAGVSINLPAYLTTAQPPGAYLTTAMQSNATTSFANGNGVTFGLVGSTLTASVAAAGGGGITNINVSAGTTSNNLSALTFANGNGISFGFDGTNLTATVKTDYQTSGAYLTTADLSQNSSKYAGINESVVTTAGTDIAVTLDTSGLTIAYPKYLTTAMPSNVLSYYEMPVRGVSTTGITLTVGSGYFQPFVVPQPLSAYRLNMMQSVAVAATSTRAYTGSVSNTSSGSSTGSWGQTVSCYLFSRQSTGTDANSSKLVSFFSNSWSVGCGFTESYTQGTNASSVTVSVSTTGNLSYLGNVGSNGIYTSGSTSGSGSTSFSSTSTNGTTFSSSFVQSFGNSWLTGVRPVMMGFATSLTPGEYWLGQIVSTNAGGLSVQRMGLPTPVMFSTNTQGYIEYGQSVSNNSSNVALGFASHSATSNWTTTVASTALSNMSNLQNYFNLMAMSR